MISNDGVSFAQRSGSSLLANDGAGHFRDISTSNVPFCATPAIGRGLACGDLDGDGKADVVIPLHLVVAAKAVPPAPERRASRARR
ncbi:MAG: hypothetical protein PVSMB10_02000 [Pseudarthrobacter sp.]